MTWCIGIDPGKTGAIALYGEDGDLSVWDMPTHLVAVGNTRRERVDPWALHALLKPLAAMAPLCVIEAVGGRPKQGAGAAFVFGFATGVAYCAALFNNFQIEAVTPAQWKRWLRVPGKAGDDGSILKRAGELFPHHEALFRGPKGGRRVDRAEAAMMARFGVEVLLRRPVPLSEPEARLTGGTRA